MFPGIKPSFKPPQSWVRRPCRVKYVPQNLVRKPDYLVPVKGQEGEIKSISSNGWVEFVSRNRDPQSGVNARGWVSPEILEVGPRAVGDTTYVLHVPQVTARPQPGSGNYSSLLPNFMSKMLRTIVEYPQDFPFVAPEYMDILMKPNGVKNIVNRIIDGVSEADFSNVDLLAMLESDKTTIDDLWELPEHNEHPVRHGVYLRIYDYQGSRDKDLYIGSTNSWGRRSGEHGKREKWAKNRSGPAPKILHYVKIKGFTECKMIPICILEDETDRWIAEQLLILFFDAYLPELASNKVASETQSGIFGEDLTRAARHIHAGKVLREVARRVANQLQWRFHMERRSFRAGTGLNFDSPMAIFGQPHELAWTKVYYPALSLEVYRRGSTKVKRFGNHTDNQRRLLKVQKTRDQNSFSFQITLRPDEPGPDFEDTCDVIFEITTNNEPHPSAWARVPTVGPFSNWAMTSRLGVRLEWEEEATGKRFTCYTHRSDKMNYMDEIDSGATLQDFTMATGIIRYLRRQQLTGASAAVERDFGLARVWRVTADWVQQSYNIHDESRTQPLPIPAPTRRSEGVIINELRHAGANVPHANAPTSGKRGQCDMCKVARLIMGRTTVVCDYQKKHRSPAGYFQCSRCRKFGRVCSYTPDDVVKVDQNLQQAIGPWKPPDVSCQPQLLPAGDVLEFSTIASN